MRENSRTRQNRSWILGLGLLALGTNIAQAQGEKAKGQAPTPATEAPVAASAGPEQLPLEDVDYGQFYVLQRRVVPRPYELGINYSYGFNNPFYGIHGVTFQAQRQFGNFFIIGVVPSFFFLTSSDLTTALNGIVTASQQANVVTLSNMYRPKYSVELSVATFPLAGLLNVMNITTKQFDFAVGLRGGIVKYDLEANPGFTIRAFVAPRLMVTEQLGVQASLGFAYDRLPSDGSWLQRIDASIGTFVRF